MTQTATVKHIISTRRAEIAVRREAACGHHCASCGGCRSDVQGGEVTVIAENSVGAQEGDRVVIETESRHVLWIAAAVYLLPFLLFFACYLFSGLLKLAEPVSVGVGAVGFVVGVVIDLLLNQRMEREQKFKFRIIKVEQS